MPAGATGLSSFPGSSLTPPLKINGWRGCLRNRWKSLTVRCQSHYNVPPADKILSHLKQKAAQEPQTHVLWQILLKQLKALPPMHTPLACTAFLQEVAGNPQWRGLVDGYLADAPVMSSVGNASKTPVPLPPAVSWTCCILSSYSLTCASFAPQTKQTFWFVLNESQNRIVSSFICQRKRETWMGSTSHFTFLYTFKK